MVKKITFLDKCFWITESADNPKHVAGLQLLELPEGKTQDYIYDLLEEMRRFNKPVEPFNCVVKSLLGFPYKLSPIDNLDMNYHVQIHQIDDVSDKNALHAKVAELHEPRLDVDKPLWQYHLIQGKTGKEFAVYTKIHHMYGDGATLVRWFQAGYHPEPQSEWTAPVWANPPAKRKPRAKKNKFLGVFVSLWEFLMVVKDLVFILFRLLVKVLYINPAYMPVPFTGTKTVLTGTVKKGRLVATCDLDFERVHALSKRLRASVNEIFLCCFDIGVHRFLMDYGHRFDKALFTNMPINMRKPGDQSSGNKIAIVPVKLAHGETDPYLRLRQIINNHRIVKKAAKRSHPGAFSYYTVLIQSVALLFDLLRISDYIKPIANILISNVPGPKETRYLKDCELKAVYPISTITPGGGVNITLLTYEKTANIGLVCTDRRIKSLDPMAEYFVEAFEMLEACIEDPSLNIDDIGEHVNEDVKAIVVDNHEHHHHDDHNHDKDEHEKMQQKQAV